MFNRFPLPHLALLRLAIGLDVDRYGSVYRRLNRLAAHAHPRWLAREEVGRTRRAPSIKREIRRPDRGLRSGFKVRSRQ